MRDVTREMAVRSCAPSRARRAADLKVGSSVLPVVGDMGSHSLVTPKRQKRQRCLSSEEVLLTPSAPSSRWQELTSEPCTPRGGGGVALAPVRVSPRRAYRCLTRSDPHPVAPGLPLSNPFSHSAPRHQVSRRRVPARLHVRPSRPSALATPEARAQSWAWLRLTTVRGGTT
jgi:hypothetical protein